MNMQESPDPRQEAIARVEAEFAPIIQAVVLAARGETAVFPHLQTVLDDMAGNLTWRQLAAALRRIVAGEREAQTLLVGLDLAERTVVTAVLRHLTADSSPQNMPLTAPEFQEALRQSVAVASRPDAPASLRAEVQMVLDALVNSPETPAELAALGRTLQAQLAAARHAGQS